MPVSGAAFTVYGIARPQGSKSAIPYLKTNPDGSPVLNAKGKPKMGVRVFEGRKKRNKDGKENAAPAASVGEWKTAVRDVARAFCREGFPIAGPVEITISFFLPRPKSRPAHKFPFPDVKPDGDKLMRAVYDALKGVAYVDDSDIVRESHEKLYADDEAGPRAEIVVSAL